MTKPVVVADAALRELERAAKWYEQQREGLGDELIDDVHEGALAPPAARGTPARSRHIAGAGRDGAAPAGGVSPTLPSMSTGVPRQWSS